MPNAFTTLWAGYVCDGLRRAGRVGERPDVAYSGVHTSLPPWTAVAPGDDVYALHVKAGAVHVVCRMRLTGKGAQYCCGPVDRGRDDDRYPGHAAWAVLGAEACGATPVHVRATPVRLDVTVPGSVLGSLTWLNSRGGTRGLKHVVDGRLERSIGLQGLYRLAPESAELLDGLLAAAPGPVTQAP